MGILDQDGTGRKTTCTARRGEGSRQGPSPNSTIAMPAPSPSSGTRRGPRRERGGTGTRGPARYPQAGLPQTRGTPPERAVPASPDAEMADPSPLGACEWLREGDRRPRARTGAAAIAGRGGSGFARRTAWPGRCRGRGAALTTRGAYTPHDFIRTFWPSHRPRSRARPQHADSHMPMVRACAWPPPRGRPTPSPRSVPVRLLAPPPRAIALATDGRSGIAWSLSAGGPAASTPALWARRRGRAWLRVSCGPCAGRFSGCLDAPCARRRRTWTRCARRCAPTSDAPPRGSRCGPRGVDGSRLPP